MKPRPTLRPADKSVSVLIPTLNCAKPLELCLASIAAQNYPPELIEMSIADGESTDSTLQVARRFTDKIHPNPLKTGEAGKRVVGHLMDFKKKQPSAAGLEVNRWTRRHCPGRVRCWGRVSRYAAAVASLAIQSA